MAQGRSPASPATLGPKARLWSLFWATLCFVGAGSLTKTILTEWPLDQASSSWPTAPGTVIAARIDSTRNSRGTRSYTLAIEYRYHIGESTLVGSRLRFGSTSFPTFEDAELVLRPYRVSAPVTVRYHPADLHIAVLQPDTLTWSDRMFLPLALLALAIGLYCFWEVITGKPSRLPWVAHH